MKQVSIEGLDRGVTQLIMGSDYFHPDRMEQVDEILEAYVASGGNTIDTAFVYSGGKREGDRAMAAVARPP